MIDIGNGFIVTAALLCEGHRIEQGGKVLLYGIYTGGVVFQKLPGVFPVSAYIEFSKLLEGSHKFFVKVSTSDAEIIFESDINIAETGPGAFPLPTAPLEIRKPGKIAVSVKINGGDWYTLLEKDVFVDPSLIS